MSVTNPKNMSRNKTESLDALNGIASLDDYFAKLKEGSKQIAAYQRKIEAQNTKAQHNEMKSYLDRYETNRVELEKMGIKNTEQYRQKLLSDYNKAEKKRKLDIVNSVYAEETKSAKKAKHQEAVSNYEDNKSWLKEYTKIEMGGGKLTYEQQEDRTKREKEVEEAKAQKRVDTLTKALSSLTNAVNSDIETYSNYQGGINARLKGTNLDTSGMDLEAKSIYTLSGGLNLFGTLSSQLTSSVGTSPYLKTETLLNNMQKLVEAGISSDVAQRAFLNTIKDDIATTFDAADSSLLRIIRLQQSDSTAARLGMESYLTKFLNNMVADTEYLSTTFDTVASSLTEASSTMSSSASTEFEYIVQKWLGTLSGVGLSEDTATSLGEAIGYLGSGNIESLSSSSMYNLLAMASTNAGYNIGDLLNTGLTAKSTNAIMESIVDYMKDISNSSTSNVVKSEYASAFGLKISDLTAAMNLSTEQIEEISDSLLTTNDMYSELSTSMNQLSVTMSTAEEIGNVFSNLEFSSASNIAQSPALSALWKVTDLIQSTTGGINIPFVEAVGSGVDLNTTVENLMKIGLVGTSTLGMIGDIISGLSAVGNNTSSMLTKLGISSGTTNITSRGSAVGSSSSLNKGLTTSVSSLVGNSSSSDIYKSTLTAANDNATSSVEGTSSSSTTENDIATLPDIKSYLVETLEVHMKSLDEKVKSIQDTLSSGSVEVKSDSLSSLSSYINQIGI